MKAQIFYLEHQQDMRDELASLLREYVYENIQVEVSGIRFDRMEEGNSQWRAALAYLNYLKSSMIKVDDFRILVEGSYGYSWYLGYEGETTHLLKLHPDSVDSVLPAVAVIDRMVMLPQGIREAFDTSREFSFFPRPLDLQGVLMVDFAEPQAIREAVRQVGAQIKSEIEKLCRRYMFVNKILRPDYNDLSRLLKIDKRFFERFADELFQPSVRLTPRIISGPARRGQQTQIVLEIQKESEDALGIVNVQVRGPADTLAAPVAEYVDFSAGMSQIQKIQFEIFPTTSPYCPFEVLMVPNDTNQKYTPFPIPLILDVIER